MKRFFFSVLMLVFIIVIAPTVIDYMVKSFTNTKVECSHKVIVKSNPDCSADTTRVDTLMR